MLPAATRDATRDATTELSSVPEQPGSPPPPPRPERVDRAAEMELRLYLDILPQPDDRTCGPTCLHAVYRYYGDHVPLEQIIREVETVPTGGTVDVLLANHALRRGYQARLYTYNLRMFDPTWFPGKEVDLAERLRLQMAAKEDPKITVLTQAYLEFLSLGGELRFHDLSAALLRKYLKRGVPILTGLSSTYLYHTAREHGPNDLPDDVRGQPQGHFVVLCGYHPQNRTVAVADPYRKNPIGPGQHYEVPLERALGAILLGVLTHDADLLLISPRNGSPGKGRGAHA